MLILLLAACYYLLGISAFSMAVKNAQVTCQAFFPEGVSLVCFVLYGPRVAPGVFLGQFLLAQATGLPPGASAVVALTNSLQGILGGHLFWRWRISRHLNRPRDIALLLVLSALVIQPISASGGVAAQCFFTGLPTAEFVSVWLYWWAGNVLGQLLILPLVLTFVSEPELSARGRLEIRRVLTVVAIYYIPVAVFVFGDWGEDGPIYRLLTFAAFYLPLVLLATRSRVRSVALANLLLTAPFLVLINAGPDLARFFSNQNQHLCADVLIMTAIVTSLLLASLWEQLNNRTRDLHLANAAKERLFSVIGHDLNAPIATLKMSLDSLIEHGLPPDSFREFVPELRGGVNRAHEMLMNLMEWGGHSMTSLQPKIEGVALRKCAAEAVGLLAMVAKQKRIQLENQIPDEAWVKADLHQIQSVMRNLLSNAIKFTREGGQVILSARREGGDWVTAVRDNGIGMSKDRAEGLFRPRNEFVSTPGTANEGGLGLGLRLCLDFLTANHGTIRVESQSERGTVFYFRLPAWDR